MIFKKIKRWAEDGFRYTLKSRNYIWTIIGLFFASSLIGFVFSSHFGFFDALLRGIAEQARNLNGIDLIVFIFNNNIRSAFLGLVLGALLGVMPLANAVTNGAILGYVMKLAWNVSGINDFWRILPHGIFELPAIFISLGLGLKLGMFIFARNKGKEFAYRLGNSLKAFIFIVIPLLVIAAVIEGMLITLL
jgi:stage II sporulation protein M